MRERRKFKRLPIHGFMQCSAAFSSGEKSRNVAVLSLSAGGMYIALDERAHFDLATGDRLENIRFDLEELQSLSLEGKVAHRMSLGEIGGCGIEFSESGETDMNLLDLFVEKKLVEFGLD